MAVEFQSIGSISSGTGTSATTSAPSGVVAGDLLILALRSGTSTTPSTPTGWTKINDWVNWFGSYASAIYWRIADGSPDDTPTVTVGDSDWLTVIVRLDGHDDTTPIDNNWDNGGTNEEDPYTIPDIAIANDGSVLVLGSMSHFSGGAGNAPDLSADGYTLRAQDGTDAFAIWSGPFDAGTDGGTEIDFGGSIRAGNFLVAIAPGESGTSVSAKNLTLLGVG